MWGAGGALGPYCMEGCVGTNECFRGCSLWRDVWGTEDALRQCFMERCVGCRRCFKVVLCGGICGVQEIL